MMETRVRILLVDDHKLVREGLRLLLKKEPDLVVVGEAADAQEGLKLAQALRPDLIAVDVEMPGQNGIDFAKVVRRLMPAVKLIILTGHPAPEWIDDAVHAGISGCVMKTDAAEQLVSAIRLAMAGQAYLAPEVSAALLQNYGQQMAARPAGQTDALSEREIDVLRRIADGESTKEIAAALNVSVKTIEARRASLMAKLGVRSVAGLTKYAIRRGLVSL